LQIGGLQELVRAGERSTCQAGASIGDGDTCLHLRRLVGLDAQLDFPNLKALAGPLGTDYFAEVVNFGSEGDLSYQESAIPLRLISGGPS
jgi:hypothetical protein